MFYREHVDQTCGRLDTRTQRPVTTDTRARMSALLPSRARPRCSTRVYKQPAAARATITLSPLPRACADGKSNKSPREVSYTTGGCSRLLFAFSMYYSPGPTTAAFATADAIATAKLPGAIVAAVLPAALKLSHLRRSVARALPVLLSAAGQNRCLSSSVDAVASLGDGPVKLSCF